MRETTTYKCHAECVELISNSDNAAPFAIFGVFRYNNRKPFAFRVTFWPMFGLTTHIRMPSGKYRLLVDNQNSDLYDEIGNMAMSIACSIQAGGHSSWYQRKIVTVDDQSETRL